MKWVLIIVWMTPGYGGSGVEVTTWPTLEECFNVGNLAQENFQRMLSANTANFSCITSNGKEPTCGGTGMEPCE